MKRICIVVPSRLPVPAVLGGAVETLVNHIVDINENEKKLDITVVSAYNNIAEDVSRRYKHTTFVYIKSNPILKKIINGINYFIIKLFRNIDFFPSEFHLKAKRFLKKEKYDAIVVEHAIYKHFSFLLKDYSRDKIYLHIHGEVIKPDKKTQKLYGNVISVSKYISNKWVESSVYSSKQIVCCNGIDERTFTKRISDTERALIRKKYNVLDDDFLLIYCGRLVEIKGVKELLKAVINTGNSKIKLMIVGAPNFKNSKNTAYLQLLQQLVDGSQCFFTGYIDNSALYKYYQSADLQVVPSLCEEGASLVSVEGMMSGLPLIVTDSGGIEEYVDRESAVFIEKKNSLVNYDDNQEFVLKLTEEILNISQNKSLRSSLSIHGIENANRFTRKAMYEKFVECFM